MTGPLLLPLNSEVALLRSRPAIGSCPPSHLVHLFASPGSTSRSNSGEDLPVKSVAIMLVNSTMTPHREPILTAQVNSKYLGFVYSLQSVSYQLTSPAYKKSRPSEAQFRGTTGSTKADGWRASWSTVLVALSIVLERPWSSPELRLRSNHGKLLLETSSRIR
jgi:hypothetical protein